MGGFDGNIRKGRISDCGKSSERILFSKGISRSYSLIVFSNSVMEADRRSFDVIWTRGNGKGSNPCDSSNRIHDQQQL